MQKKRYLFHRGGGGQPDAELEAALRRVLRAEVAGATPAADAWRQLKRRIEQEDPHALAATYRAAPVSVPARPWVLAILSVPRFSQFAVALLFLFVTLSSVVTLEHAYTPAPARVALDGLPARPPVRQDAVAWWDAQTAASRVALAAPPAAHAPAQIPHGRGLDGADTLDFGRAALAAPPAARNDSPRLPLRAPGVVVGAPQHE